MLHAVRKAVVSISIDVVPAHGAASSACPNAARLVDLFHRHALAATWSFSDPADIPWRNRLDRHPVGHELALLGDASWIGPSAGRTRFSRELARRLEAAATADIRISTLALYGVDLTHDLDLLVKHRISLLRPDLAATPRRGGALQPQSVRFGVWRAPVAAVLTGNSSWWAKGDVTTARRAIRRAAADGGFVHLAIRSDRVQPAKLDRIDKLLQNIRQHQLRGELELATLQQVAGRWMRPRAATPLQSVLREAA